MQFALLWLLSALWVLGNPSPTMGMQAPQVGDQLIPISIAIPTDADHSTYLGLGADDRGPGGQTTVDVTAIQGRLLIIEIFSMYCPHCQREAPAVNRLYQAIEASPSLRGQVKLIGIGVGNSEFEINHFRNHYQIEFPLFPDEDFKVHQDLGEVRTPFFIIVALDPDRRGTVLWTGAGNVEPREAFVARLEKLVAQR